MRLGNLDHCHNCETENKAARLHLYLDATKTGSKHLFRQLLRSNFNQISPTLQCLELSHIRHSLIRMPLPKSLSILVNDGRSFFCF